MINIDSIISTDSKKGAYLLPSSSGDKGLKENAQRRMQKAQMAAIESNLKKLQNTEDLSYSEGGAAQIDGATLARLVDECKEEQE